ncbi:MAG: FG-GAP-like repeat-containing protein, partial [Gemmataceae bacterium]
MPELSIVAEESSIAFTDSFDTEPSALWSNTAGGWVASAGTYHATAPSNNPLTYSVLPYQLTDFVFEVDVHQVADGGIWLRSEAVGNGRNGILLVTKGNTLYWHEVTGQAGSPLNLASVNLGGTPHLRVEVSGDSYKAFVNGQLITSLTSDLYTSGAVGLYSFSSQSFDNVFLAASSVLNLESNTTPSITVQLSEAATESVTVDYTVTSASATGGGVDYTLIPGTLVFAPGVTKLTLPLTIINDLLDEPIETIEISLSHPENATLSSSSSLTYFIVDDDPQPVVRFFAPASFGLESDTTPDVLVELSAPSEKFVSINYSIDGNGTAMSSGVDYSLAGGKLTFAPGETSKRIPLSIIDDTLDENDETIFLLLDSPVNAGLTANSFTYTIVDNDAPPTIGFVGDSASNGEWLAAPSIAVQLSTASGQQTSVHYVVSGGSATAGSDHQLDEGDLLFEPGEVIKYLPLIIRNDDADEGPETVQIQLSSPVQALLGRNTFLYTILDDDTTAANPRSYASLDAPRAINADATTLSLLDITDAFTIDELQVSLDIDHPHAAGLAAFLIAPDGTRVELFKNVGGTGSNFHGTTLADQAATSIDQAAAPFTGTFRPTNRLADFAGKNAFGTWQLEITNLNGPGGTLSSWSLQLRPLESITENDSVVGSLAAQQSTYYSLVVPESGLLTIHAEGIGLDPSIALLAPDVQGPFQNLLAQSDDTMLGNTAAEIRQHVLPGTYFLRVEPSAASNTSGAYTLTTTFVPSLAPFSDLVVPGQVAAMVVADFNKDGNADVVISNGGYGGPQGISVFLGNEDGTFQAEHFFNAGLPCGSIVACDVDQDGNLDLAIALQIDYDLRIGAFLGDGTGQFSFNTFSGLDLTGDYYSFDVNSISLFTGHFGGGWNDVAAINRDYPTPKLYFAGNVFQLDSSETRALAVDLDGDQLDELIVVDPGAVTVYSTSGTITQYTDARIGGEIQSVVSGDFDGDQRTDLAISDGDRIRIVFNDPIQGFQAPVQAYAHSGVYMLIACDLDGNGSPDVAAVGSSNLVSILSQGDGSFRNQVTSLAGVNTAPRLEYPGPVIASADFDHDGLTDIAVLNTTSNGVAILFGLSDGTFGWRDTSLAPVEGRRLAQGDLNSDGFTDIVSVRASTISVSLGRGNGIYQDPLQFTLPNYSTAPAIFIADVNDDGRPDLLTIGDYPDDYTGFAVLLGVGDGTFRPPQDYRLIDVPGPSSAQGLSVSDVNNDQHQDVLLYWQQHVYVFMGNGDGSFAPRDDPSFRIDSNIPPTVADINRDGKPDLVGIIDDDLAVFLGIGDGTFLQPALRIPTLNHPHGVVVADFDEDGILDLACVDYYDTISLFLGNGDGTFQGRRSFLVRLYASNLILADFNGDGHSDLVTNASYDGISILLGNGDGTFIYSEGPLPDGYVYQSGDFNNDGKLDLIATNAGTASFLFGLGDGTFLPSGQLPSIPVASTPQVASINGDGIADTLILDRSGSILYRQGLSATDPTAFSPPLVVNGVDAQGAAVLQPSRDFAIIHSSNGVVIAGLDSSGDTVSLYRLSNGAFVPVRNLDGSPMQLSVGPFASRIVSGDLDGNGLEDLAVLNVGTETVALYLQAADGQFVAGPVLDVAHRG